MELKQLQKRASEVFLKNLKRDGIKVSEDYLILKITEELGEFIQSYLIHKKRCRPGKYLPSKKSEREISKELADVLGIILVIAKTMKIDVEEALVKKWITREWLKKQ
jgi:NTP pyrophosphatase (non-canonical NTP hydrolase)